MPQRILARALAGLVLVSMLAGCAHRTAQPAADATLYQRLGGHPGISAVVEDAIANVAADSRINQRFASTDLARLKRGLVEFLCDRSGGPCRYRGRNMADAHEGMKIRADEFDALVEDLVRSLDKHRVPARDKAELLALLGRMKNAIIDH
jgi:hemoglobin